MNSVIKKIFTTKTALVILAFIAFISLGLPDGLLGVAWPSIRKSFSLPLDSLGVLLIFAVSGYIISSSLNGKIMSRLGVGGLLAVSCAVTGIALIGFTLVPEWWMLVAVGFGLGVGAGAIDAGINTYVASNFGERLMQWLHASWGIGVTLGPVIMTIGINYFHTWRWGYAIVGAAQLALAVSFASTLSMWRKNNYNPATDKKLLTDYKTPFSETLRLPAVWLSILMFFLYTGIESTLGNWTYTLLTESRNINSELAGFWAGSYWAMFTFGRIMAGFYTKRLGNNKLLMLSLLAALVGAILIWWDLNNIMSLSGVVIIGYAVAPIFPGLVSGTSERVGKRNAANTIGMQLGAAGLGVAVLPGLAGVLARHISLEIIPVFLIVIIAALLGLVFISQR
ncbi:MAG: MFS transporter [bacterium]